MTISSRTHVRLNLDGKATLADLREVLAETDRLGAPDDAKVNYRTALGGLAAGLAVEWTPLSAVEHDESSHEAGSSCGCLNVAAGPTPAFHVESVEELLGQLVGACSSVSFWDAMPPAYPYGAGTFRDDVASRLVEAATTEHRRLTEPAPPGHEDHPRIEGGVNPACVEAARRAEEEQYPPIVVHVPRGWAFSGSGGWGLVQ